MKRWTALVLLALLASLALPGCGGGDDVAAEPGIDTMRIAVVLPHEDFGAYWSIVADGILDTAGELPVDVKIYMPQFNYNVSQMTDLIQRAVAAQVDAIVVQGIEDDDYIAALEEARDGGILIAMVDTDVPSFGEHLYVGTDNYQAGWIMGETLVELSGGRASMAILSGAPGYPNLQLREQGILDCVAGYPQVEVRRVDYNQYDALTVMECYHDIVREEDVDTLLCIEGTSGGILSLVLQPEDTPLEHILVFDLSEDSVIGLENGLYDAIVTQQNYEMGVIAIQQLYLYSQTGAYDSAVIHTPAGIYTKRDLDGEG